MSVSSPPSLRGLSLIHAPPYRNRIQNSNPTRFTIHYSQKPSIQLSLNWSPAGDILRQITISSVLFLGLSINGFWAFAPSASARMLPSTSPSSVAQLHDKQATHDSDGVGKSGNVENIEDEETKAAFEQWKSKTYALTVPLTIVALQNSLPPLWFKEFLQSQGKRVKLRPQFRRSLHDIFYELSNPFKKGKVNPKSAVAADVITLGDSWLSLAIDKGLIEPMEGAEDQDWFQSLSDKWKVYLRRSSDGKLDFQGRIWAAPYRWGSMVIAYNKKEFRKRNLAPIEDWADLWRPELAGKISMVDSPREIVGAVLKYMGASYNTTNIDFQVVGGKHAVLQKLSLLVQQVRLFDSLSYLKAFGVGDVWVAVGWSSDVLPAAKRMSNVAVIVPSSGTSLWADLWAVPAASRLATDRIGGRVRGPSPPLYQWIEFCLQPERALPFKKEAIVGASPITLEAPIEELQEVTKGRLKLDTNLVANVPPAEILARCELLEPLSDDAISEYQWLLGNLQKSNHNMSSSLLHYFSSVVPNFWPKIQAKVE
ncbi:putrescine-binding periplasmic protein-related [Forsythia ovata]|uniref:Putrescine-binding periplasmic protein-related n=1 Tax=Forsythia ovata TaxID=205694 RepID=A0ABD1WE72_9LAMI